MKSGESREMYLETILELTNQKKEVRSVDIVNKMGFAKSSVSEAVKSLREEHLIKVDTNSNITLTKKGHKEAQLVLEKHQILTELLKTIGVSEEVAEQDACKMEHVISEETFNALKNHLNTIK